MFILGGVIADGQRKLGFEQVNQNLEINLRQLCQEMNQTLRQVMQVEADEALMVRTDTGETCAVWSRQRERSCGSVPHFF